MQKTLLQGTVNKGWWPEEGNGSYIPKYKYKNMSECLRKSCNKNEKRKWNKPVCFASRGVCEAVLVSVAHSNTEYHDNRLTDDWSGRRAPVSDLTAA